MGKILALLGRLTPHRRAVVEMRSLQGMPVKQIAEQLGIKPQSVNTMFRRGLRDLTRLAGGLPLRKAQAPHQTSPSPNPRIPPWPADKQPCARCGRRKPLHGRGLDLECWQIARRDGSLERYPRRRTYAQVVEEYQALRSAGLPADDIGRRMGYASTASMRAAVRSARMYVTREGQ